MRVLYPGHRYALAALKGGGETILQFAQDEPLHPTVHGPSCQEVIRALIDRVQVLDAEMPWPGNAEIIRDLRRAMAGFEARAILRKVEKGRLQIEALPTAEDGHIILAQGTEARSDETEGLGPKGDGPVPQGCAQTPPESPQP